MREIGRGAVESTSWRRRRRCGASRPSAMSRQRPASRAARCRASSTAVTGSRPRRETAVEEAIRRTGYTANHHARSLATGRANSLAFLLTEPQHLLFADPDVRAAPARRRRGARAAVDDPRAAGRRHTGRARERRALRERRPRRRRAPHLVARVRSAARGPARRAASRPCAAASRSGHTLQVPTVSVDEVESARAMTRYLLEQGHRRIAMIAGPHDTPGGRFRLVGFREEMGEDFDAGARRRGRLRPGVRRRGDDPPARARPTDIDAVFAAIRPDGGGRDRGAAARRGCGSPRTSRSRDSTTPGSPRPRSRRSRRCASRGIASARAWSRCCSMSSRAASRDALTLPTTLVVRDSA